MFNGPKERYTGVKIRYGKLALDFGNRFMLLLGGIALCWFISRSQPVRVVADHFLSGQLDRVESILGGIPTVFASHKPAAYSAAHHVGLPRKKQIHHQAQQHKLMPDDAQLRTPGGQDLRPHSVALQDQEVSDVEWQEEEPADETCQ